MRRMLLAYDYITITEVLEHIANPDDLLAKVKGHFRRTLIVSVPNVGYYTHRIRLLFGRFPLQWGQHPAQHLRFWMLRNFRWWTELQGYRIIKAVPPGLPNTVSALAQSIRRSDRVLNCESKRG